MSIGEAYVTEHKKFLLNILSVRVIIIRTPNSEVMTWEFTGENVIIITDNVGQVFRVICLCDLYI